MIYGVPPYVCSILWNKMYYDLSYNSEPKHLLWALRFLKTYATEEVYANAESVTEKTFRKWCWKMVKIISNLNLVSSFKI